MRGRLFYFAERVQNVIDQLVADGVSLFRPVQSDEGERSLVGKRQGRVGMFFLGHGGQSHAGAGAPMQTARLTFPRHPMLAGVLRPSVSLILQEHGWVAWYDANFEGGLARRRHCVFFANLAPVGAVTAGASKGRTLERAK